MWGRYVVLALGAWAIQIGIGIVGGVIGAKRKGNHVDWPTVIGLALVGSLGLVFIEAIIIASIIYW